ncbi:MAG: hypothetical protein ACI4B8_06470 [Candidatus Gastranaerophilaceae bacterium]
MKKIILSLACSLLISSAVFADGSVPVNTKIIAAAPSATTVVTPQHAAQATRTMVSQCSDTIGMNSEQLFYLTLAALNKMNYKITEVQSKTGTVLFQAYSREFLITIADKGANSTFIKILPADSNYSFSPALVQNIFGFLKANSTVTATVI